MKRAFSILLAATLCFCGCAGSSRDVAEVGGVSQSETGLASYYGHQFQGRITANGEAYDENQLTAAHRTLPFGTRVRVTNLVNGKEVVLRVNDRGPFVAGRVIDLSYHAAEVLDFVQMGVVKVRVEVLPGY